MKDIKQLNGYEWIEIYSTGLKKINNVPDIQDLLFKGTLTKVLSAAIFYDMIQGEKITLKEVLEPAKLTEEDLLFASIFMNASLNVFEYDSPKNKTPQ